MDYKQTWLAIYESKDAKTRIAAHKIISEMQCKLAAEGGDKLLKFTIENSPFVKGNEMPRAKATKPTQAMELLKALDFVSYGTGDASDWQRFVRLTGNMAVTSNGQVAAGHPIAEEITLCPQLDTLQNALKRCGKSLVISETPGGQLSVKGDKIRALVPAMANAEELPPVKPDAPVCEISDTFKEAFKVCGSISSEAAESVMEASLLLEANTCTSIGKGRATMLQYWHGINLPPAMVIPKVFAEAVVKQERPLTGFGFSWRGNEVASVTFWFEGGAWIKTQCYQDKWQDVAPIIDQASHPAKVLGTLFEAAEAVMSFSEDGHVVFADDKIMSHASDNVGAQYEVKGLQGGKTFNAKYLKSIAGHVDSIDLTTYPDRAFFFGGTEANPVRGLIMAFGVQTRHYEPQHDGWNTNVEPEADEEGFDTDVPY